MKKFKLVEKIETVALKFSRNRAENYANYEEIESNKFICNAGNLQTINTIYFDKLEDCLNYAKTHKFDDVILSEENTEDIAHYYFVYELNDNDEYENINDYDFIYCSNVCEVENE